MANRQDGGNAALSRRKVLQAGAVGGAVAGAAWVTPSVLTLDAASAASACCTSPGAVNWGSVGTEQPASQFGPATIAGYPFNWGAFGNVQMTFAFTGSGTSPYSLVFPGSSALTGRQPNETTGGATGFFGIDKQGAAAGSSVTLRITFSCLVRNLSFTILDIDGSTAGSNNYRDQVTVAAFNNGTPVVGVYSPLAALPAIPTFTPILPAIATSATFTALANVVAAPASTQGNLGVFIGGLVDRFDLTYTSAHASGSGAGSLQEVSISDMTWSC